MIKVSVIIAVYNVELYLEKCLESLINQTLEDIEIIAVNDGSTDKSWEILKRYQKHTSKLKCYTKENGGAADARNFGLQFASGEYIGYVDSDDFVDLDMLDTMYRKAKEIEADIVECNLRHTYTNSEDIEIMERFYEKKDLLMFGRYVVWNKIYRKEWLVKINAKFPICLIYEDVEFLAKIVPYIKRYDYVDIAPVHYVQRRSSVNNSTSKKTLDIFQILKNILEFYKSNGFYEEYEEALEYCCTRILLCSSFTRMCNMENKKDRNQALSENWKLLIEIFPKWKKNPVLKNQKTNNALFMRTVSSFTYKIYSEIFPIIYQINTMFDRKWRK